MYEYKISRLNEVVDGDTIDVDIDLGFDISLNKRVRLAGIDTPESRSKNAIEKKYGLEAKDWLKQQLKDKSVDMIRIKTEKPDSTEKYGRILGWLYLDNDTLSINEKMINQGYAWSYLGDKKIKDFALLDQRRKNPIS
ncbi:Thermonuclease [Patescibacteria group bacterium]|nr:Thermonuclease [Patescibacteria group bacterium]